MAGFFFGVFVIAPEFGVFFCPKNAVGSRAESARKERREREVVMITPAKNQQLWLKEFTPEARPALEFSSILFNGRHTS